MIIIQMTTVTVRFEPSKLSQTELLNRLGQVVDTLKAQGVVSKAEVEAVFPGEENEKYKGTFTVSFVGTVGRVAAALNKLSGVRDAYVAPQRAAV
jgi:allophanate hydrolase subunit 1